MPALTAGSVVMTKQTGTILFVVVSKSDNDDHHKLRINDHKSLEPARSYSAWLAPAISSLIGPVPTYSPGTMIEH
jgi:hypothetical protein